MARWYHGIELSLTLETGRSEAPRAPLRGLESVDLGEFGRLDSYDNELRNPVADPDLERLFSVVYQRNLDLSTVAGIDQAGSVEDGHACAHRKAAAWKNEAAVSFGDRHRQTRRDECPVARFDGERLCRYEIRPRITRMGERG